MILTKLNELQVPTWRGLRMNATEMEIDAALGTPYRGGTLSGAEQVRVERSAQLTAAEHLPDDLARLRAFVFEHRNYSLTITIPAGVQCDEPIMLDLALDEQNPVLIDHLHVVAHPGSRADVVVRYRASGAGTYFHGGFALLEAEPGAHVRLIKVQMLGDSDAHLDGVAACAQADGQADVLSCELGGAQVIGGCNLCLAGAKSRGEMDTIYLGGSGRTQDFSRRLELRGAACEGEIAVRGALTGTAKKTMKSTLDFIRGASGAKGREEEIVLTLSDRAVNLSVPLLLCGEADVEGAHATSSGRPDPGKLFYLMSRGLSEREAKRAMVEASFTPILNKLPSSELRGAVYEWIREVVHRED